ncbi:CRISPR-associated protein Cas4 [Aquincola sp. MAHUQ-54]|uniref:CRISPR-associated exonuclease Cas4 n=1 Tax=Aquincola agrisoli TaxID=3119538 RepID=A0AAW9QDJ2_9BURK
MTATPEAQSSAEADKPEPLPISALQHWAYCPRQCGLIHLEQAFDDNLQTLRGNAVHAQVDQPGIELRRGLRIERSLPLWSDVQGLIGKADVVEFEPDGTPYPVEYKHGSRHKAASIAACDDIQLAAQALCLAEMTGRAVAEGAIYYANSRRRRVVSITPSLLRTVVEVSQDVKRMLVSGTLPPPTSDTRRCKGCSLRDRCQPEAFARLQQPGVLSAPFEPDA